MKNSINFKLKSTARNKWLKSAWATFAIIATVMFCVTMSGCKKDDAGEKSGTIKYGNNVFTVSIGEISKNDAGNLLIELKGNLKGELAIVQGKVIPYIGMRVIVDNMTLEYDAMKVNEGLYLFSFKTSKNPGKIIVYSNDGSKATLTFDGKKKTVIK